MPIGDPWYGFFYRTLTLMMDTQSPTFKPDEMDSADDETNKKLSSHTH